MSCESGLPYNRWHFTSLEEKAESEKVKDTHIFMSWLEFVNNFLNANNGTITTIATVILAIITFWYARLTRGILKASNKPEILVVCHI